MRAMQEIFELLKFRTAAKLGILGVFSAIPVVGWSQSDLGIIEAKKEIAGTSVVFEKPHDGGSTDNTDIWHTGNYARFILSDGTTSYGLQVTAVNPTGALTEGTDSLMIAQTKSSQGLKDTSTLSVFVQPATAYGIWSLDLKFTLFDTNFDKPADPKNFSLTALDIDYDQTVSISDVDFESFTLEKSSSVSFTGPTNNPKFNGVGDSSFYSGTLDTNHAMQASTLVDNDFTVTVGSGPTNPNKSLFIFDFGTVNFTNPVTYPVPEPSTALLLSAGGAMLTIMRRRRQTLKF